MPPEDDFPPPPSIADYELLRLIGHGSYGDVWLARGVTGVFRAVKIVWRDRFDDERPYAREFEGVTRFASISVREPSQLALLHAGRSDADAYFYYVMELADDALSGRTIEPATYVPLTLREQTIRRGRLPIAEVVSLGVSLARALATLHAEGLVHRDVKPSNVVFVGGVPKLADIGLIATANAGLTQVGTQGYMPPEGPGAPSADVYGLGKVLYELATGHDRQEWPRLPGDLDTMPDRRQFVELNEVLIRSCELNPDHRFPEAGALLDELLLLQAGKSVRRLRLAERRTARALRVAALLAIVSGFTATGMWIQHQRAAKAEAARAALVWQSTNSSHLVSAQRAIGNGDLARARSFLESLVPPPGVADLRGFAWRALLHEAKGEPHVKLQQTGREVYRLVLSPDETRLIIAETGSVAVYDLRARRELFRLSGILRFAGLSSDGRWLICSDTTSITSRWSLQDGARDPHISADIGNPLAAVGPDAVTTVLPDGTFTVWNFSSGKEEMRAPIPDPIPASETRSGGLLSGASPDGRTVVRAIIRNRAGMTFQLAAAYLRGSPKIVARDLGFTRPVAVGVDSAGAWALLAVKEEGESEIWRCDGESWQPAGVRLPTTVRRRVEFDLDGARLSVGPRERELCWFDASGALLGVARGHTTRINEIMVHAKSGTIFTGATDGSVHAWSIHPPPPRTFPGWNSNAGTTRVVFAPDGKHLWLPRDSQTCVRLEVDTLARTAEAADMLMPVALDGDTLVGIAPKRGLTRVDARTGAPLGKIDVSPDRVRFVAASTDGRPLAAMDEKGRLFAVDAGGARLVAEGNEADFTMTLDGPRLWLLSTRDNRLQCRDWPSGAVHWTANMPATASALHPLPNGQEVVVSLENGLLQVHDARTGQFRRRIDSGSAAPQAMEVSPDGRELFTADLEGNIHIFDLNRWEESHVLPLGASQRLHRLTFGPGGRTLAVQTRTGQLHLIRTQ